MAEARLHVLPRLVLQSGQEVRDLGLDITLAVGRRDDFDYQIGRQVSDPLVTGQRLLALLVQKGLPGGRAAPAQMGCQQRRNARAVALRKGSLIPSLT